MLPRSNLDINQIQLSCNLDVTTMQPRCNSYAIHMQFRSIDKELVDPPIVE